MWDRFGWGPEQTDLLSFRKMKEIFLVLDQQRVSKDAVENLGSPSQARGEHLMRERQALWEAQHMKKQEQGQ